MIFHLARRGDWTQAMADGVYAMSTLGQSLDDVGFVHCSFAEQVPVVARLVYRDVDTVLLSIDEDAIDATVRHENLDGGTELFPHVYGPLPVTVVREVREYAPAAGVALRRAGLADVGDLAALHLRTAIDAYGHIFPPDPGPPTLDDTVALWSGWIDRGWTALCAETADKVMLGTGLAGPDVDDPARGHVARLYVEPARQGEGIGRALSRAALADLRERGFRHATLWALEANTRARSWYEREGWHLTGRRKLVHDSGISDVQYAIDLV